MSKLSSLRSDRTIPSCTRRSFRRGLASQGDKNETTSKKESTVLDGLAATAKWKKGQLARLSDNLKATNEEDGLHSSSTHQRVGVDVTVPNEIDSDEDVQPMWREMESRVVKRRSLTIEEAKIKGKGTGRSNLRHTDEEAWLNAGLYDGKPE